MNLSVDDISKRLAIAASAIGEGAYPEYPQLMELLDDESKPAAVLIPLLWNQNQWHVLFTRRNSNLPEHSGQVAFPGGRADPDDPDPETTALRETWEEIGIDPQDVVLLGRLPQFLTITNYLVTPIVGQIPWPYEFSPAHDEVSRIFTIPLEWLANPANHEERTRTLPAPFSPISVIYFNEYDGEILWGASARFTLTFLEMLENKWLA